MAAVSDLNIRIGVLYSDFDKALGQVEKRLQRTADRLGSIADGMLTTLTLPIAAFGAKAISAAGDMEQLRLAIEATMKGAGRTTAEANAELEALRKAALAPGLDFEQAVQGSIRLQNVGFSAEKARGILVELANAVATTGGSAQQLDGVTKQFGQMIAKGRIMQEDLGIIQENMPAISVAMEKAFGTKSAEKLRDMGVSAEQFIDGVTKQLALLPRVEVGIKNALVNAGSALQQFLAGIGEEIVKVTQLGKVSDAFSAKLAQMTQWFKTLDDTTKTNIITWAAYAAAAGPVIKILQGVFAAGASLVSGVRLIGDTLKNVTGSVLSAATGFARLSTVMKLTVAGAVIAGVVALYMAFQNLNGAIDNINPTFKQLQEVQQKAAESAAQERVALDTLIAVVKDETRSRKEREAALKQLQDQYPGYFKNMSIESLNANQLASDYNKLTAAILRKATATAAQEKVGALAKDELEVQQKRNDLIEYYNKYLSDSVEKQVLANAVTSKGRADEQAGFAQRRKDFALTLAALDKQIAEYERQKNVFVKVAADNTDLTATTNALTAAQNTNAASTTAVVAASGRNSNAKKEEKDAVDALLDSYNQQEQQIKKLLEVQQKMGIGKLDALPTGGTDAQGIQSSAAGAGIVDSGLTQQLAGMQAIADLQANIAASLPEKLTPAQQAIDSLKLSWQGFTDAWQKGGDAQTQVTDAVLGSIVQMTNEGSVNMLGFARAAAASAIKVAKAYAVQGIFAAVSKALQSVPFPLNLIAAAGAAGIAGALLNGLANKIQNPKLAKGGLAFGQTTAIVGDNPNARADPEVIAPLSKLKGMLGDGGSNLTVNGVWTLRGSDLQLVLENTQKRSKRTRGY